MFDYIKKIISTKIEDCEENKLQELLTIVSCLASFFARLRVSIDDALAESILNRLMDEADKEEEGHSDISESNPIKRINKNDLPDWIKNLFEEE